MTTIVRAWRILLPNAVGSAVTDNEKVADWYKAKGCKVVPLADVDPHGNYADGLLVGHFKATEESSTRIKGLEKELAGLRRA